MDIITSVAKTASSPSLLLHKNAVYREELRRKKVYLEKSHYKALSKIKREEFILKEKRAQSCDSLSQSAETFELSLPGFRFRANGEYKKSVSQMREERLWESFREVKNRRSLPGKRSSVKIIDGSIVDGSGLTEATGAEAALEAVSAATTAAGGGRANNFDEKGSFLHPLNTVPYSVRKVQCQLGLHYRPRTLAFLEGDTTLGPMTYTDSAVQLLNKAVKNPDLEDLAKGLLAKWKDREVLENSNSNSITITPVEEHHDSSLLGLSSGSGSNVRRRCFACRHGQQWHLEENSALHACTVNSRPRWQLVPAGKLVPPARKPIKLFSYGSDSGTLLGSSQSTQLSLTNSLPVVMDGSTASPLSYHQSSHMDVGLRKASDQSHLPRSASMLTKCLEKDQEDSIHKIAGANRSMSGSSSSSSKEYSFVNMIASRHLSLNELKKRIKDENEVLKSKVDGFLKILNNNAKRVSFF